MGKFKRNHKRHQSDESLRAVNQVVGEKEELGLTERFEIATRQHSFDFMSFMGALPNPDPVLKKMGSSIQVYENLRYDSRVSAVISSRKSAVSSMEWRVTGTDQTQVDFYTELFNSYSMHDIIMEMLDAPLYGYKPFEIIWHKDGSLIVPIEFVGKPSRWFIYDKDNKLRFLSFGNWSNGELVPENKFVVARNNPTYDNPYGLPALSACFWPVTFRKTGLKYWTVFLEKYGMPFLLGKAPEGAKTEDIAAVADLLQKMIQDAIAVVPKEYEIEIAEATEGKGKADSMHKAYLDFMDTEIAMAIVGTNLTTEVQGGSLAASQSHMQVRDDIIEADKIIVEQAFNELIHSTSFLNFSSKEKPLFELYQEEKVDVVRSERDVNLSQTGVKFSKIYYEKNYSLQDEDFELAESQEV